MKEGEVLRDFWGVDFWCAIFCPFLAEKKSGTPAHDKQQQAEEETHTHNKAQQQAKHEPVEINQSIKKQEVRGASVGVVLSKGGALVFIPGSESCWIV